MSFRASNQRACKNQYFGVCRLQHFRRFSRN